MPTVTCNACNAAFEEEEEQRLHYRSEWHRYNLKRKVAGVPGVSEALFMAITKRPYNTVRRQHQQEGAKRQTRIKKKLTKKRNSCDKPKPDEVKERVSDAGSKEESLDWPAGQGSSRYKPRPNEVNKIVVDFGSKEESMAQPAGEGKRRRMLVTQKMVDFIIGVEVVHYMLGEPLQPVPADTTPEFDFGVSDLLMEDIEEDAYVLRQYRTNKHTEFLTNEDAKLVSRSE